MPKAYRQCDFCIRNSVKNPDILIFLANENLKTSINIYSDETFYICETHFKEEDIRPHGTTKRLREGALPVNLPNQAAVSLDHPYILTSQLDMVRFFLVEKQTIKTNVQTTGCEQEIPDEVPRDNLTDDAASDIDEEDDNSDIDEVDSGNLQSSGTLYEPSQGSGVSSYVTGMILKGRERHSN